MLKIKRRERSEEVLTWRLGEKQAIRIPRKKPVARSWSTVEKCAAGDADVRRGERLKLRRPLDVALALEGRNGAMESVAMDSPWSSQRRGGSLLVRA